MSNRPNHRRGERRRMERRRRRRAPIEDPAVAIEDERLVESWVEQALEAEAFAAEQEP